MPSYKFKCKKINHYFCCIYLLCAFYFGLFSFFFWFVLFQFSVWSWDNVVKRIKKNLLKKTQYFRYIFSKYFVIQWFNILKQYAKEQAKFSEHYAQKNFKNVTFQNKTHSPHYFLFCVDWEVSLPCQLLLQPGATCYISYPL